MEASYPSLGSLVDLRARVSCAFPRKRLILQQILYLTYALLFPVLPAEASNHSLNPLHDQCAHVSCILVFRHHYRDQQETVLSCLKLLIVVVCPAPSSTSFQ